MDNVPLWSLWVVTLSFLLQIWTSDASELYMDTYGTCNMPGFYPVSDETITLHGRGGGQAYKTLICTITLRAERNEQICILFDNLNIKDRGIELMIYDKSSPIGKPKYTFKKDSSPNHLCSTGRYLTVRLAKKLLMSTNFQFKMRIMEESQTAGFVSGLDGFVMSVGVIIAIIVSVVVLITLFAVVIVCCCCKTVRNHFDHWKGTKAKRLSELQGCSRSTTGQRPTPSAPPLQDVQYNHHGGYHSVPIRDGFTGVPPPPYTEDPPPYTSNTDIQS